MTKQSDKAAQWFQPGFPTPFADMAIPFGSMFEAGVQAGQTFVENAFAVNQELMRFAGERFQADVQALQELSRCADWQDVARCQSDFARSAAEAYQAEMSKLIDQSMRATTATWKPITEAGKPPQQRAA